jgi:hypothetical protein
MTNPSPDVCRNGHPRTPENTRPGVKMRCRVCHRAIQARYKATQGTVTARLPLEPLLEWIVPSVDDRADQPPGARTIAAQCGVTLGTARRWQRCGVPLDEADEAAVALGVHPCEVWPEWWEVAA